MKYKLKSGNLYTISSKKYKTSKLAIIFKSKLDETTLPTRNLIFESFEKGNKTYNTERKFFLKLEELYDLSFRVRTSKIGMTVLSYVYIEFINPKYADDNMLEDIIKFTFDVIINPNITEDERILTKEKNIKLEELKTIKDFQSSYLTNQILTNLNERSKSSILNVTGSISDIENISMDKVNKVYNQIINEDEITMFALGDLNMDYLHELLNKHNPFKERKKIKTNPSYEIKNNKLKVTKEKYPSSQTLIGMLYKIKDLTDYERKYVANVYNNIFGEGSLNTKLYKNIRKDKSLCYYIDSEYIPQNGLILITTAVDPKNEDLVINEIKNTIKEMGNKIEDEELKRAIKSIDTDIEDELDSNLAPLFNMIFEKTINKDPNKKRKETNLKVTKEEIYNLNKKISLLEVYSLVGDSDENR